RHVDQGGAGIVIADDIIASSTSLDNAIEQQLARLYPSLVGGTASDVRDIATESVPFMVVIEDINKHPHSTRLLEKIAGWKQSGDSKGQAPNIRVLCPVWPKVIDLLDDAARSAL